MEVSHGNVESKSALQDSDYYFSSQECLRKFSLPKFASDKIGAAAKKIS